MQKQKMLHSSDVSWKLHKWKCDFYKVKGKGVGGGVDKSVTKELSFMKENMISLHGG